MKIERITPAHLGGIATLERLCFAAPWSEDSLAHLCGTLGTGFVCVDDARVIGYIGLWAAPDEWQITNVATHPDYRRRGVASALLLAAQNAAKKSGILQLSLEVRASNEEAASLYEHHGFVRVGVRRGFYKNPTEDAFVMLCALENENG